MVKVSISAFAPFGLLLISGVFWVGKGLWKAVYDLKDFPIRFDENLKTLNHPSIAEM